MHPEPSYKNQPDEDAPEGAGAQDPDGSNDDANPAGDPVAPIKDSAGTDDSTSPDPAESLDQGEPESDAIAIDASAAEEDLEDGDTDDAAEEFELIEVDLEGELLEGDQLLLLPGEVGAEGIELQEVTPEDSADKQAGGEGDAAVPVVVPRNVRVALRLLVVAMVLLAVTAHIVLAWAHRHDRFGIDHEGGVWIALAHAASEGELYPPLYDEQRGLYGGARIMPLGVVLHVLTSRLTVDPLAAAKLVSALSMAALAVLTLLAMWRARCTPTLALGLLGTMLMTAPAIMATTSVRAHALATGLQLAAIMLMQSERRGADTLTMRRTFVAALLCALALFTSFAAWWAPLAIGVWLAVHRPRRFVTFAWHLGGLLLVGAATVHLATDGRFTDNVIPLFASGVNGFESFIDAPMRLMTLLGQEAPACWALIPLAGLSVVLAAVRQRLQLRHLALLMSLGTLLLWLTDSGIGAAHLLDFILLNALCAGALPREVSRPRATMGAAQAAVAALLVWSIASGLLVHVRGDLPEALMATLNDEPVARYMPRPLANHVAADARLLCEDPAIPTLRGERPVVLDAGALAHLLVDRPAWGDDLIARIESREFDFIILMHRLEHERPRYDAVRFGAPIAEAMASHYQFTMEAGAYFLYQPREGSEYPRPSESIE